MPGADSYPEGTTAYVTDPEQRLLVKILSVLNSGGGGGGGAAQTPWAQNIDGGGFSLLNAVFNGSFATDDFGGNPTFVGNVGFNANVTLDSGAGLTLNQLTANTVPFLNASKQLTSSAAAGAGSPEGAVTAPPGIHYWQTDVGDWVKNSGTGNTGWVQHTSIV